MAKNIRLHEAPDRLSALKDLGSLGHVFHEAQITDTANRARMVSHYSHPQTIDFITNHGPSS